MTREEARIKIIEAYRIYKESLNDKNFMYVFIDKNNKIDGVSVDFKNENFAHLTGIKNYYTRGIIRSLERNILSPLDYTIDKFTELKLNNFEEIKKFLIKKKQENCY